MKANELRIGNIIQSPSNHRYEIKVLQLFSDSYQGDFGNGKRGSMMYSTAEGIPITEEWLLRFGFIKINDRWGTVHYEKDGHWVYILKGYLEFEFQPEKGERLNLFVSFHFVHELQNIYFLLTSEELE